MEPGGGSEGRGGGGGEASGTQWIGAAEAVLDEDCQDGLTGEGTGKFLTGTSVREWDAFWRHPGVLDHTPPRHAMGPIH